MLNKTLIGEISNVIFIPWIFIRFKLLEEIDVKMEMKILSTGANASGYSSMITMNGKKCLVNAGDR